MIRFTIPIATQTEYPTERRRGAHAKRFRAQYKVGVEGTYNSGAASLYAGKDVKVRIVRIATRKLSRENLSGALYAVREGVNRVLGRPKCGAVLAQEKGGPGIFAVRVEICLENGTE